MQKRNLKGYKHDGLHQKGWKYNPRPIGGNSLSDEDYTYYNRLFSKAFLYITERYVIKASDLADSFFKKKYIPINVIGREAIPFGCELSQWGYEVTFYDKGVPTYKSNNPSKIERSKSDFDKFSGVDIKYENVDYYIYPPRNCYVVVCMNKLKSENYLHENIRWVEDILDNCGELILIEEDTKFLDLKSKFKIDILGMIDNYYTLRIYDRK